MVRDIGIFAGFSALLLPFFGWVGVTLNQVSIDLAVTSERVKFIEYELKMKEVKNENGITIQKRA